MAIDDAGKITDLSHENYVARYKDGSIKVSVDKFEAVKALIVMPKHYKVNRMILSWLWIIGLVCGTYLIFFGTWWVGLLVIIFSGTIPEISRRVLAQGLLDKTLEHEGIYEAMLQKGVIVIEPVKPS
jgi:hypothetical protein